MVTKEIWDKVEDYCRKVQLTAGKFILINVLLESKSKSFSKLSIGKMPKKERKPKNKLLRWGGVVVGVVLLTFIGRIIYVDYRESTTDHVNKDFIGNENERDKDPAQISANKVVSCPGCNLAGIGLGDEYVDYGSTGLNGADLSGANLKKARLPESLKKPNRRG